MKHLILEPGNSPDARGFFSFVNQYLAGCRHFNGNDSVFISFDLVKKSKYYDTSIDYTDNVWEYFFKKNDIGEIPVERTAWGDFGNFYGYTFDFNNLEERAISEEVINKHLLLRPEISDKINKFYDENFKDKKILGVHKRGTDISQHHSKKELVEYFQEVDAIAENYDGIFISTDERSVIDAFKGRYSNVIFYSYDSLSVDPNLPNFKAPTVGGYRMGEDALIDAYLLSKTDFLIQTNSNLSNFSLLANSKLNFKRIQ
jgi:hypothetical protein